MTRVLRHARAKLGTGNLRRLGLVRADTGHKTGLIGRVLDIAHTDRNRPTPISLTILLQRRDRVVRRDFPGSVAVRLSLPTSRKSRPTLNLILTSPACLRRVILGLYIGTHSTVTGNNALALSTAAIFMSSTVTTRCLSTRINRCTMVAITSANANVTPRIRRHVFSPFFAAGSPKRNANLKLTAIHNLIQSTRKFLRIFDRMKQNDQFGICLPLVTGPITRTAPTRPATSTTLSRDRNLILMIRSRSVIHRVLRSLLRDRRCHLLLTGGKTTTLRVCRRRQNSVRLIIASIVVPILSNLAFVRELEAFSARLPVLILDNVPNRRSTTLTSKTACFLGGPFSTTTFLGRITVTLHPNY